MHHLSLDKKLHLGLGRQFARESTCLTNCGSEFNAHNPNPRKKLYIVVHTCNTEEIRELYGLVVSLFGLLFRIQKNKHLFNVGSIWKMRLRNMDNEGLGH